MKIKNSSALFFLILIFNCCGSIKEKSLYGKYHFSSIYGVGSNISIQANNKFTYNWRTGLIAGTSTGHWVLKENLLFLNSDKQPSKAAAFDITYRPKTLDQQFEITLIDQVYQYKLNAAVCYQKLDTILGLGATTDSEGNCILPFDSISNTINCSYLGYQKVEININELPSNSFIIALKEKEAFYTYFTNEQWKVKRGRLYDPSIEKDEYTPHNYYKKAKRKTKQ